MYSTLNKRFHPQKRHSGAPVLSDEDDDSSDEESAEKEEDLDTPPVTSMVIIPGICPCYYAQIVVITDEYDCIVIVTKYSSFNASELLFKIAK